VDEITNLGLILGGAGGAGGSDGFGISNFDGTLTKLTNAQGGFSGGGEVAGLTYEGNLPTNYDIVLNSATSYGELNVYPRFVGDQMTVGVSDLSTDLSTRVYANVITGVGDDLLANAQDAFGVGNGVLGRITASTEAANWDLRVWNFGTDMAEPEHALLELKSANQRNALHYDCTTIGVSGTCLAASLRQLKAGGSYGVAGQSQLAGTVAGAVNVSPTLRIGGFLDFGATSDPVSGVNFTSHMPLMGGFVTFADKADGTGLQARIAASYQRQTADINRTDAFSSQATGSTSITSSGVSAEISWGQTIGANSKVTPFVGLDATQSSRAAYQEKAGTYPIGYGAFSENQVTGTAGLRLSGSVSKTVMYRATAGVEQDLSHRLSSFDLTTPSVEAGYQSPYAPNVTRFIGQLGMSYLMAPNQELTIDSQVNTFGNDGTDFAVTLGFRIGY